MEKWETEMKQKLEMETGNRNENKRCKGAKIFFIVCLVITLAFYLAIIMELAL